MSARPPIARVRGLGSAKGGTHHWWMQRVTALALAPLTVWFVASLIRLAGADHAAAADWLASFHHLQLGLQVVIEDYIHGEAAKIGCIIGVKFASFALAVAAGVAVLKVAF